MGHTIASSCLKQLVSVPHSKPVQFAFLCLADSETEHSAYEVTVTVRPHGGQRS